MPWKQSNIMNQRAYFISLACTRAKPFKHLCHDFGISPKTGYKWFKRAKNSNLFTAVKDHKRTPKRSPTKTVDALEQIVIKLRKQYPYWGAKKLLILCKEQYPKLRFPSERTINRIFARNHLLEENSPPGQKYTHYFEYEQPNDLWQMDYKGYFNFASNNYCYPLTVLDDHSRYNLVLDAHDKISGHLTKQSLEKAFIKHGLPERMLMDRGSPWHTVNSVTGLTKLTVWLMRLGIKIINSRAYHPQTLGKDERFHRTLKYDLIKRNTFHTFKHIQKSFALFQHEYNYIRPHEALGLKRPYQRYEKSKRFYPEKIQELSYPEGAKVKKLSLAGTLFYRNKYWHVNEGLAEQYVMLIDTVDTLDVYFYKTLIKRLNLKELKGR